MWKDEGERRAADQRAKHLARDLFPLSLCRVDLRLGMTAGKLLGERLLRLGRWLTRGVRRTDVVRHMRRLHRRLTVPGAREALLRHLRRRGRELRR